jgi:hypothetical protein
MVHVHVFQLLLVHGRAVEDGADMIVVDPIGVFGVEHHAIAVKHDEF